MSRTNYALLTEQLASAPWTTTDASVQANVIVAPDGSLTGDKLIEGLDSVATAHILQQVTSASAQIGDPWTLSVYARAAERTQIRLALTGAAYTSGFRPNSIFELSPNIAAVITQTNAVISPTMAYQGNGWWRLSISGLALAVGDVGPNYQLALAGMNTYVGNGSSGLYVWGAQLESGLVATPYIENETLSPLIVSDATNPTEPIITGSALYRVPLQAGTPQTFSIQLGGITYQMMLLYRNDTSGLGGWTVDIADDSGNAIVQGIPLVTGADLLAQYKHLGFTGALFVKTTADPDAVPTFENLGADGQLYWIAP